MTSKNLIPSDINFSELVFRPDFSFFGYKDCYQQGITKNGVTYTVCVGPSGLTHNTGRIKQIGVCLWYTDFVGRTAKLKEKTVQLVADVIVDEEYIKNMTKSFLKELNLPGDNIKFVRKY